MPSQIMNIGPMPCEENAAQVGRPDYDELSPLERLHPVPPEALVSLIVKTFPHDFGSYREVCVRYEDTDPVATGYAFDLERDTPEQWDAIARYELIWFERLNVLNRAVRKGEMAPDEVPAPYRSQQLPALPAEHTFSQLLAAFPL
ncbi:hypothetical protein [Zoogloea sp.]|uniref:hypothetical protein n=1 Tax=Zoogloea sp. TaxID=49181 RepID=UPI0025E6E751|nr:hypothetical protein [Zoogloea sp.]MCK6376671.1 hypothetical protein [Zoogloea sp.]MCK6394971.1 hypothetical protein [Zoogloea sp.]MCK6410236.1 hypothetical protein [Thauera sp.]